MLRQSRFISVEIVIKTDHDCDAFVQWFQSQDNHVEKMYCETHRWYVYFAPIPCSSADSTIQALAKMIQGLPASIRKQWDEAGFREFFAGYHVGDDPVAYLEHFTPETISMAAHVGAGIGIALYPPSMGTDDPGTIGGDADKSASPNRSLSPTLKSTSSVRSSENS